MCFKSAATVLLALFHFLSIKAQDSLSVEHLHDLSYSFRIENGEITGEAKDFLDNLTNEGHIIMLGEYHGSARISEFTAALLPMLHANGFSYFAAEVGPHSARVLQECYRQNSGAGQGLFHLHNRYGFWEEDGYFNPPIPFFEYKEDVLFLDKAMSMGWQLFGIDQEYNYSGVMLLDRMYEALAENEQYNLQEPYRALRDRMSSLYEDDIAGNKKFSLEILDSEDLRNFCNEVADYGDNAQIAADFYRSMNIYALYARRRWYENNATRIAYQKQLLSRQLTSSGYRFDKDKLLVKMGGIHTSKGFSRLALYEVGSILQGLADYHGVKCYNFNFMSRFYEEEGQVKDALDSEESYIQRQRPLLDMGQPDEYVLIDLRPLIAAYQYYPRQYLYGEYIEDLVRRYDFLIITNTEVSPENNY